MARRARRPALVARVAATLVAVALFGACGNPESETAKSDDANTTTTTTNRLADPGAIGTVAFAVNVCGERLPPAPSFETNAIDGGLAPLRSNGQGDIIVAPATEAQAGENATLALFLSQRGWEVGEQAMRLWDDETHVAGQTCPDGRAATIRWTLNGEEQSGDPSLAVLHDGDEIVVAYIPDGDPISVPPTR